MKLGKQEYKFDERTVKLARFMDTAQTAPKKYNFDKGRRAFPLRVWGNDAYGDCVFAAQMNELLRVERIETRHTLPSTDDDVIKTYKTLTGCRAPDDANDQGYVMLDAFNFWRQTGWTVGEANDRQYTISAFGELEPGDIEQLRLGCYLLHGVQFGFSLPRSAQAQTRQGYWDVSTGPGSEPGSWGGHAVYSPQYDQEGFIVKTWGMNVKVSNAFIERYCDEVWCIVDSIDRWRKHSALDIPKLEAYLDEIGATRH